MTSRGTSTLTAALFLSLAVALFFRFTSPVVVEARRTFPVLGTFATLIITADGDSIPAMMQSADSLLRHLDEQLGRFSTTGELYNLNHTGATSITSELGTLILLSDSLVAATSGYFDPTLGRLIEVWKFPEASEVPDNALIEEALEYTGWDTQVIVQAEQVSVREGTYLDFGAVAKGYAVDRTYQYLMDAGAEECLVEVGGEVRCGSSTGRIWNIGINHPRGNLAGSISLTEGAVATSGDYECFFFQDGVRYSHLLDRSTGYPSAMAAGATVIAPDCATADAVATAAAVAGPEAAELFSPEWYTGMIIITEEPDGHCEIYQFGEVPWGR